MRSFTITLISCITAVNALNFIPDVFRRPKRQVCDVYTVVEQPCIVKTWITSNTVLWVEQCSTSFNITNAPTGLTTTVISTATVGSITTTTVTLSLQTIPTLSKTMTLPNLPMSTMPVPMVSTHVAPPVVTSISTMSAPPAMATRVSHDATCTPPSKRNYPNAETIPANTTYLITVSSLIVPGPLYLDKNGFTQSSPALGVKVFFYDGLLLAIDPVFGVRWYSTSSTENMALFALKQYAQSSSDLGRQFTLGEGGVLTWESCGFGNLDVWFVLSTLYMNVYAYFGGTVQADQVSNSVKLVLVPVVD